MILAEHARIARGTAGRYLPQIGYAITGTGGLLAAALLMAATGWLVVKTAVFGRWLAWVSSGSVLLVVVSSILLSGVFAIPALLVWTVAVSAAMWGRSITAGS